VGAVARLQRGGGDGSGGRRRIAASSR
jgi:hypothetical protein